MPRARKYKVRERTKTNPLNRSEEHVKAHETVLPVIESLRSARETDRKWSSAIIGELVQNDTLRLTLLREGIVNALLDRLTDESLQVQADALGSIDALILKEGESLCKEMYRKNILTLIKTVLFSIGQSLDQQPLKAHLTSLQRLLFHAVDTLYTVLTHLCEICQDANESAIALLPPTLELLHMKLPNSPKLAIVQFVALMTTDSPDVTRENLEQALGKASFSSYVEYFHVTLQSPSTGFESEQQSSVALKMTLEEIVISIYEAYLPNYNTVPNELLEFISLAKSTFTSFVTSVNATTPESSIPNELVASLHLLSSVATYLDTFFEAYPEAINREPQDSNMEEDQETGDEMEIDSRIPAMDSTPLTELFTFIPTIIQYPLPISLIPHALEAINDIAWMMTKNVPEFEAWEKVAASFLGFATERIEGMVSLGEDTLSTFLGCMWASAKTQQGNFALDAEDVTLLEELYSRFPTGEFQAKVIGILGIAAQFENIETNRHITTFLLREITSPKAWVVIEIMDTLMEVFADGDKMYDEPVFVTGQVLNQLKQIFPKLRKRVKGIDSNKEPELRERADDVLENFMEFIKYKENEARHA